MPKQSSLKTKSVAIVYRPRKPEAFKLARQIVEWLSLSKVKIYSHPSQRLIPGTKKLKSSQISKLNFVICLGGDGTYLSAVRMVAGKPIPILGVNLGSLGFLTEIPVTEIYRCLELALKNKLILRPRAMLDVTIVRKNKKAGHFLALNDIVLERGPISRLINLEIHSGSHFVCEVKSDGLIISSPTGSTAYNLAAGGPIVHPEVAAFIVTPICPHSLTNRPIALPDNTELKLKIARQTQEAVFMIDGQRYKDLDELDEVIVRKASFPHYMLSLPEQDYFELLRTKLSFGKRD
jgi:NAD+ kinase